MTQYKILLWALLRQRFRVETKSGKKNRTWVAFLVLALCCLPMLAMIFMGVISVGKIALTMDVVGETLTYLITVQQVVVLFFGLGGVLGTIYFSTDTPTVLNLPMKLSTVYAVKLTCVYIYELMASVGLALIVLLPFGIGAQMPFWYYLQMLLVIAVLPMLPLLLCSIVAIPLMWFVSFFKNKGVVTSIVYVLLFALAFGGYYYAISLFSANGEDIFNGDAISNMLTALSRGAKYIFPNYCLASTLVADSFPRYIVNFLIALGINGALFALAVLISSKVYRRTVSSQLETSKFTIKEKVNANAPVRSKTFTLVATDLKQLLRDSSMGMYCMLQIALVPIVTAFMLYQFSSPEMVGGDQATLSIIRQVAPFAIVAFMGFMAYTCNYAATGAFTREGQKFYLIKAMPIDYSIVVKSKVIIGVIFNELTFLVTVILIAVMLQTTFVTAVLTFVAFTLLGTATVCLQVMVDLKNPRLKWNTFAEGAKNNPSSLISMLIGLVEMLVVGGVSAAFLVPGIMNGYTWTTYAAWGAVILVGIVMLLICWRYIVKNSRKYFESVE